MKFAIIILGLPNSGKSTLCIRLENLLDVGRFNVGASFNQEIKKGSRLGIQAQQMMINDGWISDEIVISCLKEKLKSGRLRKGVIFEGFPGNINQAKLLKILLEEMEYKRRLVVHLDLMGDICINRAKFRKVCLQCGDGFQSSMPSANGENCIVCGGLLSRREDDDAVLFEERLKKYQTRLSEVLSYYQQNDTSRYLTIAGDLPSESILGCFLQEFSAS